MTVDTFQKQHFQNKLDALAAKITKIEDTLTTRNAYIESELTDAIASIDDLKGTCENVEKNIISAYKEYTNVSVIQITNKHLS